MKHNQQFTLYFDKLYSLTMTLNLNIEDNSNQKVWIFENNQTI